MQRVASKLTILFLSIVFLSVGPAQAQNTGSIQGTVADSQGGLIAGATVKAIDQGKGLIVRETTTAADGSFLLQPLDPGTYTIRISASGMKDRENKDVVLDSRQVLNLGELRMSLGPATESVTVEATVPLVDTATADHAAVIDSRQVTEISMNGRDFQSLVRTLPGVVSNDSSDFRLAFNNTDSFHVDGLRGSNNNVYLDGAINTDVGANDGQFTQLSMDAVGEFKLQTSNFAAEYGRNPGVLLAINTKSGTKQFHGTVYEFNRENGFDANQFFNKVNPNGIAKPTGPVPNSKLRFNQYGFNIGGPIPFPKLSPWNDKKMFFFFNFEGTRAIRPNGGTSYSLPDPKWLGIGTATGDADFSSALRSDTIPTVTAASCPAHPSIPLGTVFRPGSIHYNSSAQIDCGDPYPGNIVPIAEFSPQYAAFVNFVKPFYKSGFFPNTSDFGASVVVPFQDTYHFNKHQEVVRYDWNINAKTNFFFRWVDDSQRESQQFGIFSGNSFPALPQFRKKPGSSWSWNLVNVISPTITNEFVFGYNHLTQVVDVDTTPQNYDKTLLGFSFQDLYTAPNIRNLRPSFNAAGNLNTQPFASGWTSEARAFTWTDNLTKIAGPHAIKTGIFFDYNQAGQQPSWTEAVNFNFTSGGTTYVLDTNNGVANLLLGNYRSVSQSNGVFFGSFRFHQLELYGQDSWKVSRKLTLDYGLRWAYIGPTYTVKPFLENYFDSNAYDPTQAVTIDIRATNPLQSIQNGSICTATQPNPCPGVTNFGNPYNGLIKERNGIPPGFVDHRYNNLQPRVGFAYDPWGNGKTAIRGGFGIFHERIRQNVNSFDALGNPPLAYTPTIFNGNIQNVGPSLVSLGALTPVSLRTPAKDGKIPTLYSWSIGLQRELPWRLGLDVAYVGNQARHLQYIYDLNQFPVGSTTGGITPPPNNTWLAVAPFRGYTNVNYTDYGANSEYNALQVRVSRRFSRGLTLGTDYTYSKNIDLSDSDDTFSSVRDRFNPKLDYGPTSWDRPHVFNFNYVYDFPDFRNHGALLRHVLGGWESSGVVRAWSGTPITMTCGGNSGTGAGGAGGSKLPYCDFAGGGPIYGPDATRPNTGSTVIQWINPFVFKQPLPGTLGNTTRNEFRGPGYQNWNLSLFKNFNLAEDKRLQLRLETFNTFNHVQFAGVNTGISTSGPGQIPTLGTVGNAGKYSSARDPRQIQLGAKFYF